MLAVKAIETKDQKLAKKKLSTLCSFFERNYGPNKVDVTSCSQPNICFLSRVRLGFRLFSHKTRTKPETVHSQSTQES